ncbi:MAG: translation initiation factor IF-2 [Bacteroidota bacterium]
MSIRLVKVAKELNVGTTTIVEHLQKAGFEVENNPRTKLSAEMYELLQRDFENSIAIKEKADQLTIGTRIKKKEDEVATAPVTEETAPPVEEPVSEEESAPEEVVETPKAPEVVEEQTPPVVEEKTPEPEPEVKEKQPEPEVVAKKEEPVQEETPAPKTKVELTKPKVVGKIDLDAQKRKVAPKKKKENVQPKPKVKKEKPPVEKPVEEPVAKKTEQPEAPKKVDVEATPEEQEEFRAETPTLKGLKIKGKINLDRLQPAKKKKAEPAAPVAKKETKQEKPKEQKAEEKPKRKRRKIIVPVSKRGGQGGRRRNQKQAQPEVKEVSKKEVEDKIKATMARLSGGGKNKRQKIRREEREKRREKQEMLDAEKQENTKLQVTEFISVTELGSIMNVSSTEVITACMNMGIFVSINQRLDAEVIELVADEFGFEIEFISAEEQLEMEDDQVFDEATDDTVRSPIVTVMGHVDHGKTSLLDYIRNANVIAGEAGGITQHIGAYEVKVEDGDRKITFLDTPGHEAFTAMRARGAKVTDVAVIIIAADDNVMPQTKEAISHAQAAGVPIIFAINKIDKDNAQPERIKQELASMNLLVEEWGGEYQSQDISAKSGLGIDDLLEKILLESDMLELKSNPVRDGIGVVLEASLDKGRGYVAKMLVQNGSLKVGDSIVAGAHFGKVKAMLNERGKRIKSVGPSAPVMVLGLKGAPQAGEKFKVMPSEQEARALAGKREQIVNEQARRAQKRLSLEDIGRRLALGSFKELNLIVKGDFDGSVEALTDSLVKLSTETVQTNIVHKAVGGIIESDVLLASASDAIIVGFQVRPNAASRKLAEKEGVQIKTYSVIYDAIEEIKSAIEGMLEPTKKEEITATVEVREVYKISKVGTIAGCYVQEGKISRNSFVRIIRDGIVVYPVKEGQVAELGSLKRFKEDVREVKFGFECGLTVQNYNDIKIGDIIEAYEIVEVKQTLS